MGSVRQDLGCQLCSRKGEHGKSCVLNKLKAGVWGACFCCPNSRTGFLHRESLGLGPCGLHSDGGESVDEQKTDT